jgi:hypothetical protein
MSDSEESDGDSPTPPLSRMAKKQEPLVTKRAATPTAIDMAAKSSALKALFKPRTMPQAIPPAVTDLASTKEGDKPEKEFKIDPVLGDTLLENLVKAKLNVLASITKRKEDLSQDEERVLQAVEKRDLEPALPIRATHTEASFTEKRIAVEVAETLPPPTQKASIITFAEEPLESLAPDKTVKIAAFPKFEEERRRGVAPVDKRLIKEIKKSKVIDFKNPTEALSTLSYLGKVQGSLESEEDLLRYVIYLISAYHYLVSKSMKEETSFPFNLTEFTLSMRWALSKLETRHGVKLFNKKESDTEKLLREPPSTTLYLASAIRHLGDRSHLTPLELASAKNPNMQIFRAMWGQKFPK